MQFAYDYGGDPWLLGRPRPGWRRASPTASTTNQQYLPTVRSAPRVARAGPVRPTRLPASTATGRSSSTSARFRGRRRPVDLDARRRHQRRPPVLHDRHEGRAHARHGGLRPYRGFAGAEHHDDTSTRRATAGPPHRSPRPGGAFDDHRSRTPGSPLTTSPRATCSSRRTRPARPSLAAEGSRSAALRPPPPAVVVSPHLTEGSSGRQ